MKAGAMTDDGGRRDLTFRLASLVPLSETAGHEADVRQATVSGFVFLFRLIGIQLARALRLALACVLIAVRRDAEEFVRELLTRASGLGRVVALRGGMAGSRF